jgi:hypothetical protein
MFCPKSFRSCLGTSNFILVWITSVDSKIALITFLRVDYWKIKKKESKDKQTGPIHKDYGAGFFRGPKRGTGFFRLFRANGFWPEAGVWGRRE